MQAWLTGLYEALSTGKEPHNIFKMSGVSHSACESPLSFTAVIRLQSFYCYFKFFLYRFATQLSAVFSSHTQSLNVFNFDSYNAGLTLKDCWSHKSVTLALLMGSHSWYMTLKCNIYNQLYLLAVGLRREARAAGLHKHQAHLSCLQ